MEINILFYISIVLLFIGIILYKKDSESISFILLVISKVVFSLIMTFMIINYYGYGDFYTYYDLAVKISEDKSNIPEVLFGSLLISYLNSLIFSILQPSFYGLVLLTAISSSFYYLLLIKTFKKYIKKIYLFLLF